MAWTNLRYPAFQLVPWPPDYLSWNFRRRIFPIYLSHSAIRSGGLSQQYRMVRPYDLSLRRGCVCSAAADRPVSDVGRHAVCRARTLYACATHSVPRFDTIHSRLLVMFLAFAQPLVRGWSRYFTWLHFKRTPGSVIAQHEQLPPGKKFGRSWGRLAYWNEEGKDRHSLLREIFTLLDQENWRYSIDTGWQEWDIQIYGNFWWSIILRTVTEYHGGGKCLTRVQLRYRYVTTTVIVNLIVLTLLIYHFLNTGHVQLFFAVPYAIFALFLFLRARRLKTRVRELVDFAAYRINMNRILRSRLRGNPTADAPK